jgi:hypothetical protein
MFFADVRCSTRMLLARFLLTDGLCPVSVGPRDLCRLPLPPLSRLASSDPVLDAFLPKTALDLIL